MFVGGDEHISVKNKDHEWKVAINGKERKGEKKGPKESRKQGGKQRKHSQPSQQGNQPGHLYRISTASVPALVGRVPFWRGIFEVTSFAHQVINMK